MILLSGKSFQIQRRLKMQSGEKNSSFDVVDIWSCRQRSSGYMVSQ